MGFQLVRKLDFKWLMACIILIVQNSAALWANYVKVVEDIDPYCL